LIGHFEDAGFTEIIFVNGCIKSDPEFFEALKVADKNVILQSGDDIVAFKLTGKVSNEEYLLLKKGDFGGFFSKFRANAQTLEVEVGVYNHLWDLVHAIDDEIAEDFEYFRKQEGTEGFLYASGDTDNLSKLYPGVNFLNFRDIYIAPDASILPGNVIDAAAGPVFIGSGVRVEPHTYIIGPTYVGKDSHLVGGKITGSSVGPVCRVGGELEESIIQGYTNKYHAGFIGHAYLGEWINLGAMTTNSDLKNNYASVKSSVNGKLQDTGSLKVGSFIGDFTRTAIGTLLNTGINIGVSCNIIANGIVTDSEIPSFSWYSPRHKMHYNFVKALDTIEKAMSRRNVKMTDALKKRLKEISESAIDKGE